jgi:3-hydroxyacyl-CoA dehydrogenase
MMSTQAVAIIGAATTGTGIAQTCVAARFPIVMIDIDEG